MKLIFAQNLKTIPTSAEEKIFKFSVKIVNSSKCRTISKLHFASRLLTYNCVRTNKNLIAYVTSSELA